MIVRGGCAIQGFEASMKLPALLADRRAESSGLTLLGSYCFLQYERLYVDLGPFI